MTTEKKVRIGIIGCGGIARSKHMPALKVLPNVEIVAFCDAAVEKAQKSAKEFGTPDAKIYTDYNELLKDNTIDAVHICTSNKTHAEISIAAMKADKHVMCEKPMAKTASEAYEMLKTAKETGKKLTIAYQHRHKPESSYLKKMIERGDLGEIYYAKSYALRRRGIPNWGVFLNKEEQGGGPLIDIGTHSLDLTLWLMNNYSPKMVVGSVYKKLTNPDCANSWGPWDPKQHTVEDSAFGYIVMKNGATIILESSWALNIVEPIPTGNVVLCGTKAGAQIKNDLTICKDELGKIIEIKPDLNTGGTTYYNGVKETPSILEAKRWIDAIVNDTDVFVRPEEAYVVSQILEAIYKSAETGKPVYFE